MSQRRPGAPSRPGRPKTLSRMELEHLNKLLDKRLALVKQLDRLSINSISQMFEVSPETIRRQEKWLDGQKSQGVSQ